MKASGQLHAPAALAPEENAGDHLIGIWVGCRGDLDDLQKSKTHFSNGDSNHGPSSSQPSCYAGYATPLSVETIEDA
jgi:hypothetical protein